MNDSFFSGAYGANYANLAAETRLECKICWYVYDPAAGDDFWQIPHHTPFSALPEHWTCPECGSNKQSFLQLNP